MKLYFKVKFSAVQLIISSINLRLKADYLAQRNTLVRISNIVYLATV
jgi:hypothetical protein